jgi:hypothetical protein
MNLTVEIPDDIATQLNASGGADLSRRALEAFALDEYKNGNLTDNALRRVLGFTRYELDGFLKAHDVWIEFSVDDIDREVATLERLGF